MLELQGIDFTQRDIFSVPSLIFVKAFLVDIYVFCRL